MMSFQTFASLHTPELYRQWYNICSLYPTKVFPPWLDPDKISLGSEINNAIREYMGRVVDKRTGYARFLSDLHEESKKPVNMFIGNTFISTDYYEWGEETCRYLIPKPQMCLACHSPESMSGVWDKCHPDKRVGKDVVRRVRFINGLFTTEKVSYGGREDSSSVQRVFSPSNLDKQWQDMQSIINFTFSPSTLQVVDLPKSFESSCRDLSPEEGDDDGKGARLFDKLAEAKGNPNYVNHLPVDLVNDWHLRSIIPAYNGYVTLSLPDFRYEYDLDGIPVAEASVVEAMLAKGMTVEKILNVSYKLHEKAQKKGTAVERRKILQRATKQPKRWQDGLFR